MSAKPPPADPVYASSLRELKWILVIWLASFLWVIGYCSAMGYRQEGGDEPAAMIPTVLGMPAWVFWGIFIPWVAASVVSCWFALARMEDHPLDDPAKDGSVVTENESAVGASERG